MTMLIWGLVLFLGVHSLRVFAEGWRTALRQRMGENAFKGVYSVVSIVGFALIVWGYAAARQQPLVLWVSPAWTRHLAALLTLPAFVLLVAAYVPGNAIKARLHHPMVIAVKVWAFAHLLANNTLADLLLFGGFLVWAALSFRAARGRDRGCRHGLSPRPRDADRGRGAAWPGRMGRLCLLGTCRLDRRAAFRLSLAQRDSGWGLSPRAGAPAMGSRHDTTDSAPPGDGGHRRLCRAYEPSRQGGRDVPPEPARCAPDPAACECCPNSKTRARARARTWPRLWLVRFEPRVEAGLAGPGTRESGRTFRVAAAGGLAATASFQLAAGHTTGRTALRLTGTPAGDTLAPRARTRGGAVAQQRKPRSGT